MTISSSSFLSIPFCLRDIIREAHDDSLSMPKVSSGVRKAVPVELLQVPLFVDKLLFDPSGPFNAHYEPDYKKVRENLAADLEHNRLYLGTYFPRSLVESQGIFSNVLTEDAFAGAFGQKPVLRVLDIGSGTGGNLSGFLLALRDKGYRGRVRISSIDGNEMALGFQEKMIRTLRRRGLPFQVELRQKKCILRGSPDRFKQDLRSCMDSGLEYDVIMAWKTMGEYYNCFGKESLGICSALMEAVEDRLAPKGLCVILDVCTPVTGRFLPMILSDEIKDYLRGDSPRMGIVSPKSCALWALECERSNCFQERVVHLSHSHARHDISRVCYYVLAPKDYARNFLKGSAMHDVYGISPTQGGQICRGGKVSMQEWETYSSCPSTFVF